MLFFSRSIGIHYENINIKSLLHKSNVHCTAIVFKSISRSLNNNNLFDLLITFFLVNDDGCRLDVDYSLGHIYQKSFKTYHRRNEE